jgi:steroid delta-isomerase-like uncharacterized protein
MAAQEQAQLARTIYEAFNTNNFDRVLSLSTADVEVATMAFGLTQHGHDGFRQFMQGWKGMAPDSRVEVVSQLAGAEGVTNECRFRGTHTGPLRSPSGEIPPTGRSFDAPFVEVWRIRDGKLASLHNYFDTLTLLQQLGISQPPG